MRTSLALPRGGAIRIGYRLVWHGSPTKYRVEKIGRKYLHLTNLDTGKARRYPIDLALFSWASGILHLIF